MLRQSNERVANRIKLLARLRRSDEIFPLDLSRDAEDPPVCKAYAKICPNREAGKFFNSLKR
jgi:hypothetical protein